MNFSHQLLQLCHRPGVGSFGVEMAGYLVQVVGHINKKSPLSSRLVTQVGHFLPQSAQAA